MIPDDYRQDAKDIAADNLHYKHIDTGYRKLTESIFEEAESHKKTQGMSSDVLKGDIFEILCSIPVAVLRGICGAGLQARKVMDEKLFAWLSNNLRKSAKRPCIYMLELTSRRGRPQTLGHMREFARCARAYVDPGKPADYDIIIHVDQKSANYDFSTTDKNERRRLITRTWLPTQAGTKNQDRLREFLNKLDENIDEFAKSHDDDTDFPYPLREVGYSDDSLIRLQHQENMATGSNRFLSLFNAIAQSHLSLRLHHSASIRSHSLGAL